MTSMFWGLRLEPGKRYSTTVDKSFHVSMAALDCATVKHGHENDLLSVMLEEGGSDMPFILCNLQKTKVNQSSLDLNFMSGDRVTFFVKGSSTVHLTGFIVPEDDLEAFADEDEESEVEEEEENVDNSNLNGLNKRKGVESPPKNKKAKLLLENSDDEEPSDDDDEDESGFNVEVDSDMSDDEFDDDDDDDSEESEEKNQFVAKPEKKSLNATQTPKGQKQQKTPNGLSPQQSKKEKRKSEKIETPGSQKQNKSISEVSPQKKTVEGGVIVKDLKVGNGPACKPGKMISVYYTGRLKNNNKVFDSNTQGNGFKFRLGKGEVIKGWDVGLNGMKVGGKRLITIPAPMAYGQKGSPPTIPGNSTLLFEVELKSVK